MTDRLEFTKVDSALIEDAARVMQDAARQKLSIVTAESCTGGLIAAVLSEAPGSGDWLHGGFVVYTPAQKTEALGVDPGLIEREDVVSEAVARAMAAGALSRSPADIAVAVTGVAGPASDDDGTPVGTMHFAAAQRGGSTTHRLRQFGDVGRGACRYCAVREALALLREVIAAAADEGGSESSRALAGRSAQR